MLILFNISIFIRILILTNIKYPVLLKYSLYFINPMIIKNLIKLYYLIVFVCIVIFLTFIKKLNSQSNFIVLF